MDLKSTCDSKMHYIVFTTTINDNFRIHDFYPVLPMGKTYPFTHFHPVLTNRFYPVGKTYHANPAYDCIYLTMSYHLGHYGVGRNSAEARFNGSPMHLPAVIGRKGGCNVPFNISALTDHTTQENCTMNWSQATVIGWLVFNGTFSTKMLHHAMRNIKVC